MSVFRYPTYKIRIAPDSQKTQGLQAGDIIRRQYAERERTVYSLMCVTETGTELVGDKDAPYFIGALLDGDEPQGGELLDFVRITNLFDTARSGALYLTASDSDSPYMDVIDGMATERSLCYPVMDGGMAGVPDKSRYAVYGSMLQTEYLDADSEATRIVRIIRNAEPAGNASFGLMLTLEEPVGYPERLLVSFKVRSSKTSGSVPIRFGYTNREKTDAEDEISIGREWKYKLWVITKESKTIDFSKLSNRQPIDPGHSGHTPLEDVLTFQLKRPIGKLGVFAAKEAGEAGELCVTDLTLLEAGTRAYNYLMPQTDETLKLAGATGTGEFSLVPSSAPVTKTLATNITPEERQNPENYTPVLGAPFYPFENPWGSDSWNTPGDEHGNILKIGYTFDSEPREGLVYMPRIERNKYYAVCCLMHNSGKITVAYDVADWEDGGDYQLEFDYPSYELLQPFGGGTAPYAQPTVYYNGGASSTAGTYSFRFTITGPVRQEWQPTLFDATAADYELTVYQNVDGVNTLVTPPYVASDTAYEIRVRALKGENVDKQFSLGIAYTPKWDPSGSSLLLINMQSGATNWTGSESTEKIVIKQVDIPTN